MLARGEACRDILLKLQSVMVPMVWGKACCGSRGGRIVVSICTGLVGLVKSHMGQRSSTSENV